jgi:hypothetical protein
MYVFNAAGGGGEFREMRFSCSRMFKMRAVLYRTSQWPLCLFTACVHQEHSPDSTERWISSPERRMGNIGLTFHKI